jgi:phosphohistidine phosphatase
MRLTLLRHGIAHDHAPTDFDRALTPAGVAQLERVLDGLCASGWVPGAILHSPLVRTTQTAAAVARRFPRVPIVATAALAGDDLAAILHAASPWVEPVLVGHQPTLGELLAELLGASHGTTALPRAGVAMVEVDRLPPRRRAQLLAFLPPPALPPEDTGPG